MYMKTFIVNLNKAKFLTPILINRTLLLEVKPIQRNSYYVKMTSNGAEMIEEPLLKVDFILEGEAIDLEEVLLGKGNLKQLISFGKIKVTGSYRDFLKLEAIIKLS